MPTNLPPEYYKIEERFREAKTNEEKAALLEDMLSVIPKHKGTDHLRADLRRKLSRLKDASSAKGKVSRYASAFHIDREGAGQVSVVGPANTGKSAFVDALTNAEPEVAEYPFTTRRPTPGMMPIENIQVQLIDTPPIDREFIEPELIDLIRRADLILLMIDLQGFPIEQFEQSIAFLEENRIVPSHRRAQFPEDRRWASPPFLILVNKVDDESLDEDYEVLREFIPREWHILPISVLSGRGLDAMKKAVFDALEIIRVYSKAPGRDPDYNSPFVMKRGGTVDEFAAKIHQDFARNLKAARVWGSGEFEGQMVSRDYELHDGDVVELRI
ncbi:MAG: GTPase [Anaerolineales bacterium]|jgi:ribosome-interacting GTPase 1